ncbi:pyrroline-5-carboxylate reductase [Neisseria iguanae]|uniref:Pyrroline-5-carboxylate reductase n=1 Tax=Neisseria iguanae TaxID=90242 RepID=A0A2P7TXM3_9NEIS|nr:pyrroline-5-carboxylate reductase [Neisseria iguanae]PSJ79467.1 pyrroline-5-carboxylate reductase [Neisseria iguanae]
MNVFFLGGGQMAAAVAGGLVKQGGYRVHVADRGAEKRERLAKELGVAASEKLPALTENDVLVLAVKPQDMQAACKHIQTNGALVLSVAAGLNIETLSRYLHGNRRIVRTMPNVPSKIGLGITGMYAAWQAGEADRQTADNIMRAVGQTVWLDNESQIHAITGISGSGSGYVFYLLNALQEAALAQGFDAEQARSLTLATFKGAVGLAEQSGASFEELRRSVMSKGGTTIEAYNVFDKRAVAESIKEGVAACVARSREISQQFGAV